MHLVFTSFYFFQKEFKEEYPCEEEEEEIQKDLTFVNKFLVDCEYSLAEQGKCIINKCLLFTANNKGFVQIFDLAFLFALYEIPIVPHANSRSNYNPYR